MTSATLTARLAGPAAKIGAADWNACANPAGLPDCHPFTRYEFFAALEQSGSATAKTGWHPCHVTVERDGGVVGLMPLYAKSHSYGEYVFDQGWAEAFARAGGHYYPKLQASVPFTPVTGPRLLLREGEDGPAGRRALLSAGARAVENLGASSLHITFMTEAEWNEAAGCGFLQRTDQQFHWNNNGYRTFDDFLSELSSSRRKSLRKERQAIRDLGIEFDWLSGSDLTETHWDAFFAFYLETGRHKWGRPYLTRNFFSRIGASMSRSILLVMARRGKRPIAGALNFMGDGVLFGRNWGAAEYVPFLHFEACYYQAIEFAIAKGVRKVEAGAQGGHKLLRGYTPALTRSAHFIADPRLRRAVADYLARERDVVAEDMAEMSTQTPYRKEG
ncbi:MAG: GNAT family N-acetyltransferase [Rhizomicrobium sp.]